MQPLIISQINIAPFAAALVRPFTFAGYTVVERVGFYLDIVTADGLKASGEIAPLPGISMETYKKAKHDLEEMVAYLNHWEIPLDKYDLIEKIRKDKRFSNACASVRFGVESVLFELAARGNNQSLEVFLGHENNQVESAVLLQGNHEQILQEAKAAVAKDAKVFKLKVGDRNIPLDVKKVQDLRAIIGKEGSIRLDANRVWSLSEAVLFGQLIGYGQIEFIEEPIGDASRISEFYHDTHLPVALDESLLYLRCGVTAPGRCSPTLAVNEGVKAYIIKPMVLGGIIVSLDWINEARQQGKKAIISSCFESQVGMRVLKILASLTDEVSGLGTEQWLKA